MRIVHQSITGFRFLAATVAPMIWMLYVAILFSMQACSLNPTTTIKVQHPAYTNLFIEAGMSQTEVDKRIQDTFQQLFHGDPESQAVYYAAGKNGQGALAYIKDVNSNDVRSEGMSYGMMIAVQLNKKAEFDALWNWARNFMYHSDKRHPAYGFFAWSMTTDGHARDEMPAPDGEQYFVTALYFAATRWGNGQGIYNYSAEADRILTDMLHRQIITGQTQRGEMTATSLFDENAKMVRFTPDAANADHTDPSYQLPAFYEVWARVGPRDDRQFWKEAAQTSRDYFVKVANGNTALTPDYGNFDATPWAAPWRAEAVDFRYDAWRSAMNWSMDWAWWGIDPREVDLSNRIQTFFENQGMNDYQSLYTLDGTALGGGHATGLVAMNAAASIAANQPRRLLFVKALWDKPIPDGHYRYYDGMLYMFGLLNCGGQYRVWVK